ncbi:hypothetical protein INR49_006013, partial [Caranx melampygus]
MSCWRVLEGTVLGRGSVKSELSQSKAGAGAPGAVEEEEEVEVEVGAVEGTTCSACPSTARMSWGTRHQTQRGNGEPLQEVRGLIDMWAGEAQQKAITANFLIPSPPQFSHPHSIYSSSTLPYSALPNSPVPAPHAGANFRASSLDPSIQLEASLHPCLAWEHLSWMCSTERSNPPLGHVKGVLEGRKGGALGKVEGGSRLAQSTMLFNHAKVP